LDAGIREVERAVVKARIGNLSQLLADEAHERAHQHHHEEQNHQRRGHGESAAMTAGSERMG